MDLASLKKIELLNQKLNPLKAEHGEKMSKQQMQISRLFIDEVIQFLKAQDFVCTLNNEDRLIATFGSVEIGMEKMNRGNLISGFIIKCSKNDAKLDVSVTPKGGFEHPSSKSTSTSEIVRLEEDILTMTTACESAPSTAFSIAYKPFSARMKETNAQSVEELIGALIGAEPTTKKTF